LNRTIFKQTGIIVGLAALTMLGSGCRNTKKSIKYYNSGLSQYDVRWTLKHYGIKNSSNSKLIPIAVYALKQGSYEKRTDNFFVFSTDIITENNLYNVELGLGNEGLFLYNSANDQKQKIHFARGRRSTIRILNKNTDLEYSIYALSDSIYKFSQKNPGDHMYHHIKSDEIPELNHTLDDIISAIRNQR